MARKPTIDIERLLKAEANQRAKNEVTGRKGPKVDEIDLPDDAPDWIKNLRGAEPVLPDGQANPDFYRRSMQFITALQLWYLHAKKQIVNLSALRKNLSDEAATFGIDLTQWHSHDMFGWLKSGDLLEANQQTLNAILLQLEKINPQTDEESALKKNWVSLIDRLILVQKWAKLNEFIAWTYIGRDQEKGGIFDWQTFHIEMADCILSSESAIFFWPSGHGKTNLLIGLTICALGRNPKLRIAFVYNSSDVTKRVQYMREIVESPRYRAVYPGLRVDTSKSDTKSCFYVIRAVPSIEPSLEGRAVRQKSEGTHYDKMVIDDPHGQEAAYSQPEREADLNAINNTWYKRLNPGGQLMGSQTRWHDDDWVGTVLKHQRRAQAAGLNVESGDIELRIKVKVVAVPHSTMNDGKRVPIASLWENRFPLLSLLAEQINNPLSFARDRLGDPAEPGSQCVSCVRYYGGKGNVKTLLDRWLSIDPAYGTTKEADFSGCVRIDRVFRHGGKGLALIKGGELVKKKPDDLAQYVRAMFVAREIDAVLLESKGGPGAIVIPAFLAAMPEYSRFIHTWPGVNVDKTARLSAVSGFFERGLILFPGMYDQKHERWVPEGSISWLVDNVLRFSAVTHPDGVDALTQFLIYHRDWLDKSEEHPQEEPKAEEPYEIRAAKKAFEQAFPKEDPAGDLEYEATMFQGIGFRE